MIDRSLLLALALLGSASACAVPSSPAPTLSEPPIAQPRAPEVPQRSTRERLEALMIEAEIDYAWELRPEQLAAARELGLSTDELLDFSAALPEHCRRTSRFGCPIGATTPEALALTLLAELGGQRGLERLVALELLGIWQAEDLVDEVLEQRVLAAMQAGTCQPPSEEELATARADLDDFRVLEASGGKLHARVPTPDELDDLAYFMVAVADAGPVVGEEWEQHGATVDAELELAVSRTAKRWTRAITELDVQLAYAVGKQHLRLLGWPGPILVAADPSMNWGGAGHSYVMRDMARIAEVLGEHAEARELWTRANPGGGACGTGNSGRWQTQVQGAIRSAEELGDCRAVVAERLLDVRAYDFWSFGASEQDRYYTDGLDYGTRRLVAAGFDLARLYRGALLTRNRDSSPAQLIMALEGPDHEVARARLLTRGNEAWDARVLAIEGLADTLGRPALDPLLELAERGDRSVRRRAIVAIGRAGRRFFVGRCDPDETSGGGGISSAWSRIVHPFGHDCATRLDDAEVAALVRRLSPHLRDADPEIRVATAEAFVDLLALSSLTALRKQARREARQAATDEDSEWVEAELREAIAELEAAASGEAE